MMDGLFIAAMVLFLVSISYLAWVADRQTREVIRLKERVEVLEQQLLKWEMESPDGP